MLKNEKKTLSYLINTNIFCYLLRTSFESRVLTRILSGNTKEFVLLMSVISVHRMINFVSFDKMYA